MSTNENPTPSDEVTSEQAITIQPSSITAYPGSGDWMPAGGNDAAQEGVGGLAVLHAVRRHLLVILSTGLACAAVAGTSPLVGAQAAVHGRGLLELAPTNPTILGKPTADQAQQVQMNSRYFATPKQSLLKSRFVIMAALRDPRLKNRACILREDATHNTIAWLTKEVRADFPSKNAGIMQVTATEPDREDAAAMVNAVVDAYMNEVVNFDRQQRRDRLSELTADLCGERERGPHQARTVETGTREHRRRRRRDHEGPGGIGSAECTPNSNANSRP